MPAIDHRAQLSRAECLRLIGSVPFGRVVFTSGALPAVRLARHLAVDGQIVLCASLGAAVRPAADGTGPVVAYEADLIDGAQLAGWSVVVVGRAALVADEALAARYREALDPARAGQETSQVITITTEVVTGYRLNPGAAEAPRAAGPPMRPG
jgi:hypothetical protein